MDDGRRRDAEQRQRDHRPPPRTAGGMGGSCAAQAGHLCAGRLGETQRVPVQVPAAAEHREPGPPSLLGAGAAAVTANNLQQQHDAVQQQAHIQAMELLPVQQRRRHRDAQGWAGRHRHIRLGHAAARRGGHPVRGVQRVHQLDHEEGAGRAVGDYFAHESVGEC